MSFSHSLLVGGPIRGGCRSAWRSVTSSIERSIVDDRFVYMVNPAEAARHTVNIAKGRIPVSFSLDVDEEFVMVLPFACPEGALVDDMVDIWFAASSCYIFRLILLLLL